MDPISISILAGAVVGTITVIASFRKKRSPKGKIKKSEKQAIRDALKASKEYQKKAKKTVKKNRKSRR